MPKQKAYVRTQVAVSKSVDEIKSLLNKRGVYSINTRDGYDPTDHAYKTMLGFGIPEKINERYHETPVAFIITLDHAPNEGDKYEQERRSVYRVLLNHIKAIFTAIDYGLIDLKEGFMPHIMTVGPEGQLETLYQRWLPNHQKALASGRIPDVPYLPALLEEER